MHLPKLVGYLLIVGTTAACIVRYCWIPYRCGAKKAGLERLTIAAMESPSSYVARKRASQILAEVERCLNHVPTDLDLQMIAAANYRILERPDVAIAIYRRTIRMNRRPEIYWNLGRSYYEAGRENEAFQWMLLGVSFAPQYLVDKDLNPSIKKRLEDALREREELIRSGRWQPSEIFP